jgi:phosphoglycolate phosphatase
MKENNRIVLSFDLDNTIINNREGIVNSFNYALNKYKIPKIDPLLIERMIGRPLHEMFAKITDFNPILLVSAFREFYSRKGIYQVTLLPGIKSKLKELKEFLFVMGIITSKKQEMAQRILEIIRIKQYFNYIIGETVDTKELGKLDPKFKNFLHKKYPGYQIIVIGDHPKDVLLSNNLDCPFIGVLTGNHSSKQLKEIKIGKILIINSASEITVDLIYSLI